MSKGVVAILCFFFVVVPWSLFAPWIGILGYCVFVGLAPQWTWRFDIPDVDFQKFVAGGTLAGLFLSLNRFEFGSKIARITGLALLSYLTIVFVSYASCEDTVRAFEFLDPTWKLSLMWFLGILAVEQEKHLKTIVWWLVVCHAWLAYETNNQYFSNGYILVDSFRWNGLDNNTYSIMTIPVMALALSLALYSESMIWRSFAFGTFVLQLHQIMLLQSRGTMTGGLVMIFLAIVLMPRTRINFGILFLGLILGSVLAGPSVVEEFMSSFKSEGELDSSADSRFKLWKAGFRIMQDYPFGVGPWIGERYVPIYYDGDLNGVSRKALHNLFFEVGTGMGFLGVVAILVFYFVPFCAHWRVRVSGAFQEQSSIFKAINLACLAGVPGFWVSSMFSSGALLETPYLLIVFCCIAFKFFDVRHPDTDEDFADQEIDDLEFVELPNDGFVQKDSVVVSTS